VAARLLTQGALTEGALLMSGGQFVEARARLPASGAARADRGDRQALAPRSISSNSTPPAATPNPPCNWPAAGPQPAAFRAP